MQVKAHIVRVNGDDAWVESSQSGCGRCAEPGGCGMIAQPLSGQPNAYRVHNPLHIKVGTMVHVEVMGADYRRSLMMVFGVPLGMVIFAAIFARFLGYSEPLFAGGGLLLSVFWLFYYDRSRPPVLPVIVSADECVQSLPCDSKS